MLVKPSSRDIGYKSVSQPFYNLFDSNGFHHSSKIVGPVAMSHGPLGTMDPTLRTLDAVIQWLNHDIIGSAIGASGCEHYGGNLRHSADYQNSYNILI